MFGSGKEKKKKRLSLTVRTINMVVAGCLVLGLTALLIGLSVYGYKMMQQHISHAFETASHASLAVSHGADARSVSDEVMEIYRSLTPEQRAKTGSGEYRSYFSGIDTAEEGDWAKLYHILEGYIIDLDDVYIAMYDDDTDALVYISDPDPKEAIRFSPGEWEAIKEKEVKKFLNWDGEGMLYDVSPTQRYGWMCTAGCPLRDGNGRIYAFVLADVTVDYLIEGMKDYVLKVTLGMVVLTLAITYVLTRRVKRLIVDPIDSITEAAKAYVEDKMNGIEGNDHFESLNIESGDELEHLSKVMDRMEKDIADHEKNLLKITEEKQRINTELDMAAKIQTGMIPHQFPPYPDRQEIDIYASMDPARVVGGDFYDYFMPDKDHLGIVIADVSGKGIPAALFTMVADIVVKNSIMFRRSVQQTMDRANRVICGNNQEDMFLTMWLGMLEISTGKMTCCNAGHEYPAIMKNGRFELLKDKHDFVLGGFRESEYHEYEMKLEPGDRLFLYTDGVPEASNASHELFCNERMLEALNKDPQGSAKQILHNVAEAVDDFVKDAEQFDDLTMLCLEYRGKKV